MPSWDLFEMLREGVVMKIYVHLKIGLFNLIIFMILQLTLISMLFLVV